MGTVSQAPLLHGLSLGRGRRGQTASASRKSALGASRSISEPYPSRQTGRRPAGRQKHTAGGASERLRGVTCSSALATHDEALYVAHRVS